tara:strand:+ start:271 stop:471 length:201 start_codon:yes stop_codon:yes gene_type:complete
MPYVLKCHTHTKPTLKKYTSGDKDDGDKDDLTENFIIAGIQFAMVGVVLGFFAVVAYRMKVGKIRN